MDNGGDILQLCRLCLVKDDVNIPIFEEQGDIRQIFLKISSCLPVKVNREDKLPKKICDGCSYKLDMFYEFWNGTANAEKQLLAWLGEAATNKLTDSTVAVETQQIKPVETVVKQEEIDPSDIHTEENDDDKSYMFPKISEEEPGPSATATSNDEPPPKRARRTAAVKAQIAMDPESDDDEDSGEPLTKIEDESEESEGEDHEPTFVDVPSTSADDQPGPSGVGKDGAEGPVISSGIYNITRTASTPCSSISKSSIPINSTVSRPLRVNSLLRGTNGSTPSRNSQCVVLMPRLLKFNRVIRPISRVNPTLPRTFVAQPTAISNTFRGTPVVPQNICTNRTVLSTPVVPQPICTNRTVLSTAAISNTFRSTPVVPQPIYTNRIVKKLTQTKPTIKLISKPLIRVTNQFPQKIHTAPVIKKDSLNYGKALNGETKKSSQNKITIPFINSTPKSVKKRIIMLPQQNIISSTSNFRHYPNSATAFTETNPISAKAVISQAQAESPFPPGYKNPFDYLALKNGKYVSDLGVTKSTLTKSRRIPNKWECQICSEVRDSKESLIDHYEFHKKEIENPEVKSINKDEFECPLCFKHFYSAVSYETHGRISHEEREFVCQTCNFTYSDAYTLSIHNFEKHSGSTKILTCCVCKEYTCKFSEMLKDHINSNHKKDKIYKCNICDKTFSSLSWLNQHSLFHVNSTAVDCNICQKTFSHIDFLQVHNNKYHAGIVISVTKLKCDKCDLNFVDQNTLLCHMRTHSKSESSLCFVCGKIFGDDKKLQLHLKVHSGTKNEMCNVCGKSFLQRRTLVIHLRTHSGEKPHKCMTCGKCFSQRSPLVIHQRHHTGDRPYVCPKCNKGFFSKSALCIHRKTCKANFK